MSRESLGETVEVDSAGQEYLVVVNEEQQYSVWPATRELPAGWLSEGTRGSREECLHHIERVWTDMRPASVRRSQELRREQQTEPSN
ncbi:MbtH protein [Spinactinospora alkalitolerans]|uniref:MbtH protein n=1 Tax=Spinactinospora alkalitolerans TaxID=687207 RepID=A0A852TVG0_9ACTN|nr:MbtH family NRPS accessory protein [Spinactinospora alkalitolerans]NYE48009.1 MbtH protein [Spinactinospora alkalitolerans]